MHFNRILSCFSILKATLTSTVCSGRITEKLMRYCLSMWHIICLFEQLQEILHIAKASFRVKELFFFWTWTFYKFMDESPSCVFCTFIFHGGKGNLALEQGPNIQLICSLSSKLLVCCIKLLKFHLPYRWEIILQCDWMTGKLTLHLQQWWTDMSVLVVTQWSKTTEIFQACNSFKRA